MGKKLTKFLTVLFFILAPYFLVSYTIREYGLGMGFGVMVLIVVALFIYLRPKIYTIIGRRKYFNDHDEGFKWLEKAYATGKMSAQQSLVYAYLLLRDGHLDKAERLISAVLLQKGKDLTDKNKLAADLNMSIIRWKRGDLEGAIKTMEKVFEKGYRSTVAYGTLGTYYLLNNDLARAEEFCQEAMDYNAQDVSIRDNLGTLYIKKGEFDKAEEVYKELFDQTEPTFIEAFYNYGYVLEQKGDLENALLYYTKALGCPEKYLSTVKLSQVDMAYARVENLMQGKE